MENKYIKIGANLKELVDFLSNGNVEKFARDYKLNPQSIRKYIRDNKGIFESTLNKIVKNTGCSKIYLEHGIEPMFLEKNNSSLVNEPGENYTPVDHNKNAYMITELLEVIKTQKEQIQAKDKQIEFLQRLIDKESK